MLTEFTAPTRALIATVRANPTAQLCVVPTRWVVRKAAQAIRVHNDICDWLTQPALTNPQKTNRRLCTDAINRTAGMIRLTVWGAAVEVHALVGAYQTQKTLEGLDLADPIGFSSPEPEPEPEPVSDPVAPVEAAESSAIPAAALPPVVEATEEMGSVPVVLLTATELSGLTKKALAERYGVSLRQTKAAMISEILKNSP